MDRFLDVRERIAIAGVATAFCLALVTIFLPSGFWSAGKQGYLVGVVALTTGLVLGLVGTGPAPTRNGAVDPLLSAVVAWYVGFSLLVHGEFVAVVPEEAPTTAFGHFALGVGLATTGWLPLGVVGFVSGTVVRVPATLLGSAVHRVSSGENA